MSIFSDLFSQWSKDEHESLFHKEKEVRKNALGIFFEKYQKKLYYVIKKHNNLYYTKMEKEDIEDIVVESFIELSRKIELGRSISGNVYNFLCGIAINKANEWGRNPENKLKDAYYFSNSYSNTGIEDIVGKKDNNNSLITNYAINKEQEILDSENFAILQEKLNKLYVSLSEVCKKYFNFLMLGYENEDMAEALGQNKNVVKDKKSKCLIIIKEKFKALDIHF